MLSNKTILITAGPTHEPIDPVRFIGNHSSGKMGYALADMLAQLGNEVHLVSGPTNLADVPNVHMHRVKTAQEMYEACLRVYTNCDIAILAAAVADYTPKHVASKKLKKNDNDMFIELKKTTDIAFELGKSKRNDQLNIGFALETNNEFEHAKSKLERKNFDFIVLNSLRNVGTCFGSDNNQISIIKKDEQIDFSIKPKIEVAQDIIEQISKTLES